MPSRNAPSTTVESCLEKVTRYPPGSPPKRREVRTPPKTNMKNGKTTFTMEKQPLKIDVLVFPVLFKIG